MIKCCVSSAGRPTEMQDMNAEELPKARSMGDKTGCGYMFGDTYHNGLKPYKSRTETTCVATVAEIMEASGLELAAVLDLQLPEVVPAEPEVEEIDDSVESSEALLQVAAAYEP